MGRANGEAGRLDRELVRVAWVTHSKGVTQQGTQADRNMRHLISSCISRLSFQRYTNRPATVEREGGSS